MKLCRSHRFFPWQTIWDLLEKFQLQEIYLLEVKGEFIKITDFMTKYHNFHVICIHFQCFSTFACFCIIILSSARSQKNFLWQPIWDLLEKFQLEEIYWLEVKSEFIKITRIVVYFNTLGCILGNIWSVFEFSTFCTIRLSSADLKEFFLDKQSEIC